MSLIDARQRSVCIAVAMQSHGILPTSRSIIVYCLSMQIHLPYPDACTTCAAVLRKRAIVKSNPNFGAGRPVEGATHSALGTPAERNLHLLFYCWKGSTRRQAKGHHLYTPNTDKVRPTATTRSYSLRLRHRIRRPHLPRRRESSLRKFWSIG